MAGHHPAVDAPPVCSALTISARSQTASKVVIPATRTANGSGWLLLSRCATSQMAGSVAATPSLAERAARHRTAERFTDFSLHQGRSSTPDRVSHAAARSIVAPPAASISNDAAACPLYPTCPAPAIMTIAAAPQSGVP